ncbi:MAG: glutamate racemase [Saprospiraceae bacterium]
MKQQDKYQPIGVFDSGIGGLTVANAILKQLPNEQIIYFGDTAHLPYGDKSTDAICFYCLKIVKFLLEKNCKLIVIACNSASSAAYNVLIDFFAGQALFVSVVDPLVDAVVEKQFKNVGVIATKATIRSDVYRLKLMAKQPELNVISMATPLLVPMIEEGFFNDNISDTIIEKYLGDSSFKSIEALLLACTHYPLIRKNIETFLGPTVQVFDSNDVVAQAVRTKLKAMNLLSDELKSDHQFYVSDFTHSFEETTRLFYKEKIDLAHCPIW